MSDSYILHDVMRKVKADGLFDSIRRDLISDIEQKSSYLDLKSNIESLMSSYLSEHKWSPSLKKSDIRERARRHIETSNLIKDTLPSLVNQYMQTCQQQLVQPRLSSFVSDHIEHVYNSIGGTHVYRPPTSYTQPTSTPHESTNQEKTKEPITINKKPQTTNIIKKKVQPTPTPPPPSSIPLKKKSVPIPTNPIKEEKKSRILSPVQSPNELIDISPSPPSVHNERTAISLSPSPPPPIVRIAPPLAASAKTETPRKIKRSHEHNEEKKKKIKTEAISDKKRAINATEDVVSTSHKKDSRKLRSRRPNPKYSKEQFEIDGLEILEPSSSSPPPQQTKPKKFRHLKPSTSFEQEHLDTPSSPPPASAPIETSLSIGDMSPEYGTSLPSPTIEKQQIESMVDEQSRTPSPVSVDKKKSASPRRLRPRRAYERSLTVESTNENSARTSSKTRESSRHRTEANMTLPTSDDNDLLQPTMKKTRHPSSSNGDNSSNELPSRSISVPDNLNTTTDETQSARVSPTPITAPVSKSFIWKPKISK